MEETSVKSSKATQKKLELDVSTATPEFIKVYSKRYISYRTENFLVVRKIRFFFLFCNKPALVDRSEPVTRENKRVQPAPNASKTFFSSLPSDA